MFRRIFHFVETPKLLRNGKGICKVAMILTVQFLLLVSTPCRETPNFPGHRDPREQRVPVSQQFRVGLSSRTFP